MIVILKKTHMILGGKIKWRNWNLRRMRWTFRKFEKSGSKNSQNSQNYCFVILFCKHTCKKGFISFPFSFPSKASLFFLLSFHSFSHIYWVSTIFQSLFLLRVFQTLFPLQYSCLGNPTDRVARQATVHSISKLSWTWLSDSTIATIVQMLFPLRVQQDRCDQERWGSCPPGTYILISISSMLFPFFFVFIAIPH